MESSVKNRMKKRLKRAQRVRSSLFGTAEKPRLSVLKTNQHITAQLIDDERGVTLGSASTLMKELRSKKLGRTKEAAKIIGQKIAEIAKSQQISRCVFDRGRYQFHGIIADVGNAARESGLQF